MPCQTPGTVSFSKEGRCPYRNTNVPNFRQSCGFNGIEVINDSFLREGFRIRRRSFEPNKKNNQLTKPITALRKRRRHSHCSCRSRRMSPLLPLRVADSLVSRASNNGAPESGRRGASSSERLLRLESSRRSGQARNGTVLQPCKSWRSHGCLSSAHTQ